MKMIAAKAGVSQPVVSQVLNGLGDTKKISQKTQKKVLSIAERMNYRRNAIAHSMKTGKTNVIGVVGSLYSGFCMEIICGISEIVAQNNYMIKLFPGNTKEIKNIARQCVEQRLAGVICRSLSEEGLNILRNELEPNSIPIVLVDSSFSHDWCPRVVSDDFEGAKMATEYLLKLGHHKIAFITSELSLGFSQFRYDGYLEKMAEWGIKIQNDDICIIADQKEEISRRQRDKITDFLKRKTPTAVFGGSDPMAMKVMNIAQNIGIKIPQSLSVIGFAGLEYAAFATPSLTTVKQPFKEMGRKAAEILLKSIEGILLPKEMKLPVELIIRDSCKKITKERML